MAMLISDYEHYISVDRDFSDPMNNGGRIGASIDDDSLNVIMPEITASERETGIIRRSKVFMKNASANRKMLNNIFFIKQDLLPPDRIRMIEAMQSTRITLDIAETLDGGTTPIPAGTDISISNVVGSSEASLVDRKIMILGVEFLISSVNDTTHHFTLSTDVDFDVAIGTGADTSDDFDFHEDDEDFATAKKYTNSVIMESITNGVSELVIPKVDKDFFLPTDPIVLVDGYYRVLYRGVVDSIADHATNVNAAVVTLAVPYAGVTIPALESYLCNGVKQTLTPGETKSFWLELDVQPESAIDSEVINQFQTGASFDDVAAV